MEKVIIESQLYIKLYFKRIFSIKNILFSIVFTWIVCGMFLLVPTTSLFTMIGLASVLSIVIINIFIYISLNDKFHLKTKNYFLIMLLLIIIFNVLLSLILISNLVILNKFSNLLNYSINTKFFHYNHIYEYDLGMFIYQIVFLGIITFFIISILNKISKNNKTFITKTITFSLILIITLLLILCYFSDVWSQSTGTIKIYKDNPIYLFLILPWSSFYNFIQLIFRDVDDNLPETYFQIKEGWGYVWISQYVWLFILTTTNVLIFKYKKVKK